MKAKAAPGGGSGRENHAAGTRLVFLVGFMGAGKSKVGAALAAQLGWPFIDLDGRIEAREKRRIAEIFREAGENAFRRAESEELRRVVNEVGGNGMAVVALGGGAFVQPENAGLIRRCGCSVFLDAPVEELWQRAQAGTGERPLAFSENHFRQLYAARRKRYMEADYHIQTGGRTVEEVARETTVRLQLRTNQGEPR